MGELPSVTQIVGAVAQHWVNFDDIPSERLEAAKERGTDYHALAAAYAQGLWVGAVPPNCDGFLKSFINWFDANVEDVVMVEKTLVHPTLHYQGTEDLVVLIKGDLMLTLLDHKTPRAFSKTWRLQLAAYKELVHQDGWNVGRVASLQPHPEGCPAKFVEYTKSLTPDFARFLAAKTIWDYFEV